MATIPLGQFAQPGPAAQPQPFDPGSAPQDYGTGAEAMGAALQNIGNDIKSVGDQYVEKKRSAANAYAANQLLEQEDAIDQARYEVSEDVRTKKITPDQAQEALQEKFHDLPEQKPIPYIDDATATHLAGGVEHAKRRALLAVTGTVNEAESEEYKTQFGRGLDTLADMAARPGADVVGIANRADKLRSIADQAGIPTSRTDELLRSFKQNVAFTHTQEQILRDPYGTRAQLGAQLGMPTQQGAVTPDDVSALAAQMPAYIAPKEGSTKNPHSTANGPGQFIDGTWLDVLKRNAPDIAAGKSDDELLAMKTDPRLAKQMTVAYATEIGNRLQEAGQPVTKESMYLGYQFGDKGALQIMTAPPDKAIGSVIGEHTAKINRIDPSESVSDFLRARNVQTTSTLLPSATPSAQDATNTKALGFATTGNDGEGKGGSSPASPVSMLSGEQLVQLYHASDAEVRRIEAEQRQADEVGRVTFRQQVQDTETALRNGDAVKVPDLPTAVRYLGPEAGPIVVQHLQTLQSMAGAMTTLKTASPADTVALLDRFKPTGTDNREARQQAYDLLHDQSVQIAAQRKADPGQYVLDNNPQVAQAYQSFNQLAAKGLVRSPDETATMMAWNRRYLDASLAEQKRLGIDQPQLPKAYVAAIAKDYQANIISDPRGAAQRLEATAGLLKDAPFALNQLSAAVGPVGLLAMEGVSPPVVQSLTNLSKVSDEDRRKMLPAAVKETDISAAVAQAFAPLNRTFLAQNATDTAARYSDAAMKLAMDRVTRGEDATTAAQHVYADLIADRYHPITDTYRVPLSYSLPAVQGGMRALLERAPPTTLAVPIEPGFSHEESAQRMWRTARTSGHWVNNGTDSGVYLFGHDGRPVLTKDGKPLFASFDALSKLKPKFHAPGEGQSMSSVARFGYLPGNSDDDSNGGP